MRLIVDLETQEPAFGVALDEALLEGVRSGAEDAMRFWINERAVVIGRSQHLNDEVDRLAAERHGFAVVRRMSGGTVLHYPGNLNLSLILSDAAKLGPVEVAFERVGAAIIDGLTLLGAEMSATSHALFSGGSKISGAAQARRGEAVLYHATLLVKASPISMPEILLAMRSGYDAGGVASRPQPVTSLEDALGRRIDLWEVVDVVARSVQSWMDVQACDSSITDRERERAQSLVTSRYGRWTWTASR